MVSRLVGCAKPRSRAACARGEPSSKEQTACARAPRRTCRIIVAEGRPLRTLLLLQLVEHALHIAALEGVSRCRRERFKRAGNLLARPPACPEQRSAF